MASDPPIQCQWSASQNGVNNSFEGFGTVTEIPTWFVVVAAAIRDGGHRLLLQEALPGKHHAGLWEFPGGKVESAESPRVALAREVCEELGLAVDPAAMRPLVFADPSDEPGHPGIVLLLYDCPIWNGVPRAMEGQMFGWFGHPEAVALPLAPLDRFLFESCFG